MKILFAEKVLKVLGKGSYDYQYSNDGSMMFIEIDTECACLFDDDIQKIKRIFKRVRGNKVELQYISLYYNKRNEPRFKLNCVVS